MNALKVTSRYFVRTECVATSAARWAKKNAKQLVQLAGLPTTPHVFGNPKGPKDEGCTDPARK